MLKTITTISFCTNWY